MSHSLTIAHDERELLRIRKHWFVLFRDTASTILAGILPLVVITILFSAAPTLAPSIALVIFFAALWLVLVWMAAVTIWTNYYLDMWVVTDKRIIYVEQVNLFSREITTLRIERIQDATVTVKNFIETLFNFGTLRIQSAGAIADDLEVHGIPDPERVKQIVLSEVDRQVQERVAIMRDLHNPEDLTGDS